MSTDTNIFSIERFEKAAYGRDYEVATFEMARLLETLNKNYGSYEQELSLKLSALLDDHEFESHVITRLCSAMSCLFSDPEFELSDMGYELLISWQRWISASFAAMK